MVENEINQKLLVLKITQKNSIIKFGKQNPLLHIVPFSEGPNENPKGFAKQKQKT